MPGPRMSDMQSVMNDMTKKNGSLIRLPYKILFSVVILVVVLIGAAYINYTWKYYWEQYDRRALALAEAAAAFIPAHLVSQLPAAPTDLHTAEYELLKTSLTQFIEQHDIVQRAYLYNITGEDIKILVDSGTVDYPENFLSSGNAGTPLPYRIPFTTGAPYITGPITDETGTWVKALIPINEYQSRVIAVLGVDYPVQHWYTEARKHAIHSTVITLSLLLVLTVFYFMVKKNRELHLISKQLRSSQEQLMADMENLLQVERALFESERNKAVLLSHLPGMAYRCLYDENWTMLFVSQGCQVLTGYPPESLLYNRDLSYEDIICLEYREILRNLWKQVVDLKTSFKYEYEILTASGERKWVLELGQAVYNENDEVEALEGLIIDIHEQKLREFQIKYMNDHDFLTGLYNRQYFETVKQKLDDEEWLPLSIIIIDINGVRIINDAFGHAAGDQLIAETARIITDCCREGDIAARIGGDEFGLLLPKTDNHTAREIADKIKHACYAYNKFSSNDKFRINVSMGCSTKTLSIEDLEQIEKIAEEQMYNSKLLNRHSSHNAILSTIMATLYARSQETEEHSNRIAHLSKKIGKHLNLTEESLNDLQLLAMLHDIGKVGIDDRILNKAGPLNEEEWEIMKKHPEIGYRIAMSTMELESVAEYILHHHERWDGSGYPRGLKGESIPLLSRILAVVDAFDAMTEGRVYRQKKTKEAALEEIKRNAGTQFDPNIAEIFLHIMNNDQL